MLCWVAQVAGWLGSHSYLRGPLWHAHEMIFGFAFAVIAGFLFTAVRNWTSQPTPNGASLAAIAALWLSGRLLVVSPFPLFAAAADAAFAFAVAAGIAVPLYASRSRRNYFFVLLLLALGAANLAFHLAMAGIIEFPVQRALQAGLDVVLVVMAVIAGMTLGMMTRTARGHTGRPLETTAAETTAYVLVQLAAATRVLLPIAVPSLYHQSVVVSGLLWTGAFAMFVWQFAPILWQARIDGRPG